ncbi:MAG TPA: DUF1707 domain-containing protein [Streptosporangiaceae bacterium]|nr:DUF1707 domain-containing protein [Streptosporangiaceae bacterium]
MSNPPEPAHSQFRVSDTDRENTAEVLRVAAGDGRITFDELDERLGVAYAAKTYADLSEVTRDLPGSPPRPASFPLARLGGSPGSAASVAIMSEVQRTGSWVVPQAYSAVAIMGGVRLDLREARFSEPEVTIQALALMGSVDVVVPSDIEVDVSGIGFMGSFDHRASGAGIPGAPRVKIIGFALMGTVEVKRKPLKEITEGSSQH